VTAPFSHLTKEQCMKLDLMALLSCDAIYILKGYKQSNGAMVEMVVAEAIGLHIYYEGEL